jgi:penicillin-binding protein 1C
LHGIKALAGLLACLMTAGANAVPTFAEVRSAHRPSDVAVVDRSGVPLQTVRVDKGVRRLDWVSLDAISPALREAVVASEDKRFHAHAGIDWQAVATSAWSNATGGRTRGASTLTMQLAGLLDDDLARPRGGRSVGQKIGQALTAARLERAWSKTEILEAYLNRVPFRGEIEGVGALAETLFSKHPSGLDAHEAAVAAALLRSPNAPAETGGGARLRRRRPRRRSAPGRVRRLEGTGRAGSGAEGTAAAARTDRAASGAPRRRGRNGAGRDPTVSATVPTTLSAPLQRLAVRTLRARLAELGGRNVEDGAVLVLDNASGEVLAWVGSSGGGLSDAADVDAVVQRRQPGSTLKPFVYALAIERRLLTAATPLDDAPAEIGTAGGAYVPQNYDKGFQGLVSARAALGASLNIPAVRVGEMVGVDALHGRLNALGFALDRPAGWYGASLALGSADVTLLALTNAYRTLANGGVASPVVWRHGAGTDGVRVRAFDARAAAVVADILADDNARVRTFGWGSALATRGWAAVKTGTSKDMRDNWCLGFTDRYTIGVWVGNASGQAMHGVSGTDGAAPVWQAIAAHLHAGAPSKAPPLPAGVERRRIVFEAGREPPRDELFLAGTAAADGLVRTIAHGPGARRKGIAAPRDGTVFAIDPDIPPQVQQIAFEGETGRWLLDGRAVGSGDSVRWAPWPGRHRLELVDATGRTDRPRVVRSARRRGQGGCGAVSPEIGPSGSRSGGVIASRPAVRGRTRWSP